MTKQNAILNAMLVRWQGGFIEGVVGAGPYGRIEGFLSLGNVLDPTTASWVASQLLPPLGVVRPAIVVGLEPQGASDNPYRNFKVGDTITQPDELGNSQAVQVQGLTVTEDAEGNPIFVPQVNVLKDPLAARLADWLNSMSNGTLGGNSLTASPVSSTGPAVGGGPSGGSPIGSSIPPGPGGPNQYPPVVVPPPGPASGHKEITYRAGAVGASGTNNVSVYGALVTVPTTVRFGDFMVAFISMSATGGYSPSAALGWTLTRRDSSLGLNRVTEYCFTRIADASDAGAIVTFPITGPMGPPLPHTLNDAVVALVAYYNVDPANPVNVTGVTFSGQATQGVANSNGRLADVSPSDPYGDFGAGKVMQFSFQENTDGSEYGVVALALSLAPPALNPPGVGRFDPCDPDDLVITAPPGWNLLGIGRGYVNQAQVDFFLGTNSSGTNPAYEHSGIAPMGAVMAVFGRTCEQQTGSRPITYTWLLSHKVAGSCGGSVFKGVSLSSPVADAAGAGSPRAPALRDNQPIIQPSVSAGSQGAVVLMAHMAMSYTFAYRAAFDGPLAPGDQLSGTWGYQFSGRPFIDDAYILPGPGPTGRIVYPAVNAGGSIDNSPGGWATVSVALNPLNALGDGITAISAGLGVGADGTMVIEGFACQATSGGEGFVNPPATVRQTASLDSMAELVCEQPDAVMATPTIAQIAQLNAVGAWVVQSIGLTPAPL